MCVRLGYTGINMTIDVGLHHFSWAAQVYLILDFGLSWILDPIIFWAEMDL